jgi:hypothetical protein
MNRPTAGRARDRRGSFDRRYGVDRPEQSSRLLAPVLARPRITIGVVMNTKIDELSMETRTNFICQIAARLKYVMANEISWADGRAGNLQALRGR